MPELLFHYTSPEGMLAILKSRCIWATDIKYMNDSAEFDYALELVKSKISQKFKTEDYSSPISYLLNISFAAIDSPSPVYVAALSQAADLLSQWRAYCPPTGGFAIGFKKQKLTDYANRHGLQIEECTYDSNEQEKLLGGLIDSVYRSLLSMRKISVDAYNKITPNEQVNYEADLLKKLLNKQGEAKKIIATFFAELLVLAPRFKHPSFSEEVEFRLICRDHKCATHKVEFRSQKSLILPYIEIGPLDSEIIYQITIGPSPHAELSERSLARLAYDTLGQKIKIVRSNTPYRNW